MAYLRCYTASCLKEARKIKKTPTEPPVSEPRHAECEAGVPTCQPQPGPQAVCPSVCTLQENHDTNATPVTTSVCVLKDNIKTYLTELGVEDVDWTPLARTRTSGGVLSTHKEASGSTKGTLTASIAAIITVQKCLLRVISTDKHAHLFPRLACGLKAPQWLPRCFTFTRTLEQEASSILGRITTAACSAQWDVTNQSNGPSRCKQPWKKGP